MILCFSNTFSSKKEILLGIQKLSDAFIPTTKSKETKNFFLEENNGYLILRDSKNKIYTFAVFYEKDPIIRSIPDFSKEIAVLLRVIETRSGESNNYELYPSCKTINLLQNLGFSLQKTVKTTEELENTLIKWEVCFLLTDRNDPESEKTEKEEEREIVDECKNEAPSLNSFESLKRTEKGKEPKTDGIYNVEEPIYPTIVVTPSEETKTEDGKRATEDDADTVGIEETEDETKLTLKSAKKETDAAEKFNVSFESILNESRPKGQRLCESFSNLQNTDDKDVYIAKSASETQDVGLLALLFVFVFFFVLICYLVAYHLISSAQSSNRSPRPTRVALENIDSQQ